MSTTTTETTSLPGKETSEKVLLDSTDIRESLNKFLHDHGMSGEHFTVMFTAAEVLSGVKQNTNSIGCQVSVQAYKTLKALFPVCEKDVELLFSGKPNLPWKKLFVNYNDTSFKFWTPYDDEPLGVGVIQPSGARGWYTTNLCLTHVMKLKRGKPEDNRDVAAYLSTKRLNY